MGACVSTIINACKEFFLSAIPSTQLVPDSEETDASAMTSTVVADSGEMPPLAMSSIPSTQPSVLSAIPSMQLVPDSEETDPSAMSSTVVPDSGEMVPSAMSSNPSTQPSVLSAIPSMQLVPASEETDPSAMSSTMVPDSGEVARSAMTFNHSTQPSVLSAIPSMQLAPDSEETDPSAMSSTVVSYSGEMGPSAMSFIPSMLLCAIPSSQLVPDSEETDPSAMTSTVVADSGEMAPLAMSSIPSKQPSVLSALPSMQLVPYSEETDPSAMSSIPSTHQSTSGSVASTSSSIENASDCGKYEVFINHRGVDTKDSLASTIYHGLGLVGVRAFLDREELEAGEELPNAIKEAIWSAFVHIAIFSPKYAESPWCLRELTLMLQTGKKIIPIFYHVDTSDVRHISGDYSKAFSSHEEKKRYPLQQLQEWKTSLSRAADIKGYEVNERQKDEGLVLKKIVNDVIKEKEKKKNTPLLHVATHPVGLDKAIEELDKAIEEWRNSVDQCAQSRHNVKILGIVGLGGCGKTTLVTEYFNQKRSFYPRSSFLLNVRDAETKNSLHDLQKQLLKDLVHIEENFHNTRVGKGTLEHRVQSVKALIVLDDVDHINQIEALLPLKGNLQSASLIIVTTRDSGVIAASASLSPSVSISVYKKGGLDTVDAKQLFCWHALSRDSPAIGFEDLVDKFLTACQGLPLSLKVLGAQLCGNRSRRHWESFLRKISQILPDDIKQILKVSYDALDEQQQQMFLDVACFFIGEPIDTAISIWDGSDGFQWSVEHDFQILVNKCLVEVVEDKFTGRRMERIRMQRIRMHDHLRDLGREIAIKKKPSRFWSLSQFADSQRPLEERLPIRGIMAETGFSSAYDCMQRLMEHSTSRSRRLTPSAFGLQILVVSGNCFNERFAKLSEELVWLRWYGFPHEQLPSWLATGKLRVLELYWPKTLAGLWGPNDSPPSQLRELIIDSSFDNNLQMIPETIGVLKHLKKIVVRSSGTTNKGISNLPKGFCLLESLEHLELQDFKNLSSLPTHFGNLRKLKYIDLKGANKLAALPASFNQLTELKYLDLSRCCNLQLENDILENITNLEILRLDQCSKLQQLPSGITRQIVLRELSVSHTRLMELPADIYSLARLEVLEIGSPCLTSLPTALGNLSCLNKIKISGCRELTNFFPVGSLTRLGELELQASAVESLPEGFGQLVNLQRLQLFRCPIRELPLANPEERYSKKPRLLNENHVDYSMSKLPRLKSISLDDTKVSTISISEDCCPTLEGLHLHTNDDLMEIQTLPTTLKLVEIRGCKKLESLRGLAGLVKLQGLTIESCPGLFELPSFADLVELQDLRIDDCPQLHKLPSFAGLVELQDLKIYNCPQLHKLPSLAGLVELRDFSIAECPRLDELPSFACCTCLKVLEVQVSDRITKIEGLEELRSLERLRLETYWKVPGIKDLKNLDKLTALQIRAESRSTIETCIPPNILKRPCMMGIVGRAVEDVESVVGSLSFPNLTVVDKLHRSSSGGWTEGKMKAPLSNASCVIVCFVISFRSQKKGYINCSPCPPSIYFRIKAESFGSYMRERIISPLEGKQVYIGVCPEGFDSEKVFMEGSESLFLTTSSIDEDVQIEKGIAVLMRNGEEEKTSEALQKFLELVER